MVYNFQTFVLDQDQHILLENKSMGELCDKLLINFIMAKFFNLDSIFKTCFKYLFKTPAQAINPDWPRTNSKQWWSGLKEQIPW